MILGRIDVERHVNGWEAGQPLKEMSIDADNIWWIVTSKRLVYLCACSLKGSRTTASWYNAVEVFPKSKPLWSSLKDHNDLGGLMEEYLNWLSISL